MNNPTKGILTIAGGSPMYGNLALSLCASIRAKSPEIGIAVAYTASAIERVEAQLKALNVQLIELREDQYMDGEKRNFFKTKTFAYELSPFEETLFLDSDTMWLNQDIDNFFNQFKDADFSICNEGKINVRTGEDHTTNFYMFWAEYDEILSKYATRLGDYFYQCRSEVFYFRKGRRAEKLFRVVRKIYDNPKVSMTKIGNCVPDELAFNIATSTCEIYPHKDKWIPAYWQYREHKVSRTHMMKIEIASKFPILSVGGNVVTQLIRDMYQGRNEGNFKKLKIRGVASLKDKRDVLPERKRI